jgi:purine-binding chemotaxis protein CheW
LGLGLTEATAKHVIIVVNSGERTIGLLVDAVSDILTVSRQEIQSVPDVMRETQNDYVEGIAVLDGRMVTLLGMTKLTSSFGGLDSIVDHAA